MNGSRDHRRWGALRLPGRGTCFGPRSCSVAVPFNAGPARSPALPRDRPVPRVGRIPLGTLDSAWDEAFEGTSARPRKSLRRFQSEVPRIGPRGRHDDVVARAGLLASSFAEECEADLFNEGAVVWGAVPEILIAGFDTLVEAGVSEEVAYLECVGELKLIAELIEVRGIAGMRQAISNTAELGAVIGGPRIVDGGVRARMREMLAEVRAGNFAQLLKDEEASGYPRLRIARERALGLRVEQGRRKLID